MSGLPRDTRPLSPHLQVYRPQLTSVLSISHRATGIVNVFGLAALVYWLAAAATGPQAYAQALAVLSSPAGMLVGFAATYAFFYHLSNGIRHLLWDTGRNFELEQIHRTGWMVVGVSLGLTALLWGIVLGGGGVR